MVTLLQCKNSLVHPVWYELQGLPNNHNNAIWEHWLHIVLSLDFLGFSLNIYFFSSTIPSCSSSLFQYLTFYEKWGSCTNSIASSRSISKDPATRSPADLPALCWKQYTPTSSAMPMFSSQLFPASPTHLVAHGFRAPVPPWCSHSPT